MTEPGPDPCQPARAFLQDQQGVTGLETAIILTAFVVVSAVFAFASLSTGLFTTGQAKGTIDAGLAGVRRAMELRGPVLVTATTPGVNGFVSDITFRITNSSAGEAIDLSAGNTIIKYSDKDQTVNLDASGEFTITSIGSDDGDTLLEQWEVFEIQIPDLESGEANALSPQLGADKEFTLEVMPPSGAVLFIQRRTPLSLDTVSSLD